MNEENTQLNIKEEVIKKIESGDIQMKSKKYFVLKLILLATLIVLIFSVSTFLLSYILFGLSSGGHFIFLRFGFKGFYHFVLTLPWLMLILNVLLVLLLDRLLKSFRFGYKSPVLYLFIGTFIFVTLFSSLLNLTSFHGALGKRADERKLPNIGNKVYSGIRSPKSLPGSYRGVVVSISMNTFEMSQGSSSIKVIALPNLDLNEHLKVGDIVFVAGEIIDNQIKAYGIKKLNK
jgi:hypothetical protein